LQLTGLDLLFWALSLAGHCILLAVLCIRHRASVFPVFTSLIGFNILRTVILRIILVYFSPAAHPNYYYFNAYWTLFYFDIALQLAIAYELASHVFKPLGAWAPDVRSSFIALISASIAIAGVLTWLAVPPTRTLRLAIVIRSNFFSSALVSELFVAMVALSVTLGLPWRTHVARIAQGLGVYSLFGIFTEAAHTYFGSDKNKDTYATLSHIRIALYLICLLYWIVTLAMKEPEPRKLPEELHRELRALQRRVTLMLQSLRTVGGSS
jgi:hypothetical protein